MRLITFLPFSVSLFRARFVPYAASLRPSPVSFSFRRCCFRSQRLRAQRAVVFGVSSFLPLLSSAPLISQTRRTMPRGIRQGQPAPPASQGSFQAELPVSAPAAASYASRPPRQHAITRISPPAATPAASCHSRTACSPEAFSAFLVRWQALASRAPEEGAEPALRMYAGCRKRAALPGFILRRSAGRHASGRAATA